MKTRGGNHIYLSMPHVIHVHEREIRVLDAIKGGERRRTCDEDRGGRSSERSFQSTHGVQLPVVARARASRRVARIGISYALRSARARASCPTKQVSSAGIFGAARVRETRTVADRLVESPQ